MKPLRLARDKKRIRLKGFRQHSTENGMNKPRAWEDGMILDDINNAMPPEELKELNEKNLEGRVRRIWISEKNEEMQNSTSKEIRRINCTSKIKKERYLSSFDKNLDELLKNELNHEEPPCRTPMPKGWRDKIEGWKNKMSLAMI